ncbi:hypothetical protein Fmac_032230 [Flemingia macrophylla]|uniref:Carboxypeptidase n=1 Tax=Flemingia macrophylla TaxID=520843 RepID=A0ABD1L4B7_9FABA
MGRCWLVGVIIVVGCASLLGIVGVEGYSEEDLMVRLPGQPKVGFKQFSGYVDVDVKHGRSLFYYFVEAEKDPHKKPLTLWLNGGPECSSIGGGAFTELGPFYPKGDGRGLRRNSMSWNKASNLLFVESPAGVGWSYSNTSSDYNTGDTSTANDMYLFLLKWYEKFPSYRTRELFLTGESYAGHYIPQLTNALLDHNAHSAGFKFNIKGVAIGNPLLRLDRDAPATYEYFWSHGMISDEIGLATKISVGVGVCMTLERRFYFNLPEVQKALHANRTNLPYSWSMCSRNHRNYNLGDYAEEKLMELGLSESSAYVLLSSIYTALGKWEDVEHARGMMKGRGVTKEPGCSWIELKSLTHVFVVGDDMHLQIDEILLELKLFGNFDLNYSDTDGNINILPILKRIIQNHIPVWVFSGDQDSVVPLLGSRTLVRELAHELQFRITVPYGAWFHKGQVGGWVTEYGNLLTFATVRGAAHMVPYAQPSRALHLFSSFVRGRRLPNTTRPSIDE